MKINPVKGTADYLPSQTLLRDYLQNIILETYREAGFERIMTPRPLPRHLRAGHPGGG